MKEFWFILFSFFLVGTGFSQYQREDFPNVLDIRTQVTDSSTVEHSFFSDQGAWFAYALPKEEKDYGSFIGPLLMKMDGKWLANTISKLSLKEKGKNIDLAKAKVKLTYFPGLLQQVYEINDLKIKMELIFVSKYKACLQTEIINLSKRGRKIEIVWKGEFFSDSEINYIDSNPKISFSLANKTPFSIEFRDAEYIVVKQSGRYIANSFPIKIKGKSSFSCSQIHTYYPGEFQDQPEKSFKEELIKNKTRWDNYLNTYLSTKSNLTESEKQLAVKSIVTLMTNWRAAAGDLLHDGVFPSASYDGFYGFWSWDSWKQSVALSSFNPSLAKANIQCMFDYQDNAGMVADCIYFDKSENNWRDTKPPLATWAVIEYYKSSSDLSFVEEMYPKLVNYHSWWYANRDHDKNGLCEYGSTDGTLIAAKWESGMDNAVRFDKGEMLKNNATAWSMNIESVDLNSYLYKDKLYLAELARILRRDKEAVGFENAALVLKNKINGSFYDPINGFYYDKMIDGNLIKIEASEGFLPLWAGIADIVQARNVMNYISNEKKLNTYVPFPTLTADHSLFNPQNGYWRGPVWLDQFYFGVEGLKKYGYGELGYQLVQKLLTNGEGIMTDQPIRENYHPITGKGLNAVNFSWSAAHILLMIE